MHKSMWQPSLKSNEFPNLYAQTLKHVEYTFVRLKNI